MTNLLQGDPGTTVSLYDLEDRRWLQSPRSVVEGVQQVVDSAPFAPPCIAVSPHAGNST